jgi:hypothetical protein
MESTGIYWKPVYGYRAHTCDRMNGGRGHRGCVVGLIRRDDENRRARDFRRTAAGTEAVDLGTTIISARPVSTELPSSITEAGRRDAPTEEAPAYMRASTLISGWHGR